MWNSSRSAHPESSVSMRPRELTPKKWATLATCSHDTALRDIQRLIDLGLLRKDSGGGRSTSSSLRED